MTKSETALRAAGIWLAIEAALLGLTLVFHGPLSPIIAEQLQIVSGTVTRWSIVHWMAAAALSCFVVTALVVLASTAGPVTLLDVKGRYGRFRRHLAVLTQLWAQRVYT